MLLLQRRHVFNIPQHRLLFSIRSTLKSRRNQYVGMAMYQSQLKVFVQKSLQCLVNISEDFHFQNAFKPDLQSHSDSLWSSFLYGFLLYWKLYVKVCKNNMKNKKEPFPFKLSQAHNSCLVSSPSNYFVLSYMFLVYLANFSLQSNFYERYIYSTMASIQYPNQQSNQGNSLSHLPYNTPFPLHSM